MTLKPRIAHLEQLFVPGRDEHGRRIHLGGASPLVRSKQNGTTTCRRDRMYAFLSAYQRLKKRWSVSNPPRADNA